MESDKKLSAEEMRKLIDFYEDLVTLNNQAKRILERYSEDTDLYKTSEEYLKLNENLKMVVRKQLKRYYDYNLTH